MSRHDFREKKNKLFLLIWLEAPPTVYVLINTNHIEDENLNWNKAYFITAV
jgi:hypothetical protein